MVEILLSSQNLCRLLYYDNENPLSKSNPDIDNTSILLFNNIYPLPKPPTPQENEKSYLTIHLTKAKRTDGNSFKDYKLIIGIVCHINLWKISGGLRPLLISHEIDELFNKKRDENLSIGQVLFDDWVYQSYSDYFCGYYQVYNLTNFN